MKRNLLIFGICLALVLGCLALLGGSKQPPAGDPGSSLELPENVPADTEVHTAGDGIKVIDPKEKKETPAPSIPVTPETVWQGEGTTASHSYTPPDKAALEEEDCIGILSIPAIDLEVKAIDPGMADMLSVMDREGPPTSRPAPPGTGMWLSPPTTPPPMVPPPTSRICTS